MEKTIINNELTLTRPEGYHIMSDDELKKYFGTTNRIVGIYSSDDHSIISVSWTKPGFLNRLTSAESLVSGNENCMIRRIKKYNRIVELHTEVASQKAYGIKFEYTAIDKDVEQYGEMISFRCKNKFYVVTYTSRSSLAEQNNKVFESVLNNLSLTD